VTARDHQHRRRLSLGTKLALVTSCVLVVVSTTLFLQLAAREHTKLVAAKTNAASMLTQLLAIELSAALDFGDTEDTATQLNHLRTNPDIVAAAVWSTAVQAPAAVWTTPGSPTFDAPTPAESDGATVSPDWLVATRTVANRAGLPIARLRVVFSLAPENQAFHASRLQLLWATVWLTLATAGLLVLLARRYVLGPLGRLAEAADSLAKGDLSARVEPRSNDEIGDLTRAFNVMGEAVAFRQERLRKEVDLAQRIQASILPKSLVVPGLELAAKMTAATEVGGDYYDVVPLEDGCWIGIGDVAGHGLDTGLIMLMTQAIVAALVTRERCLAPRDVVCKLNEVLFDNIRNRLERYDHVTFTLLRYDRSGRVVFAGAHEDIIVYRADERRCEIIETPGTWLGGRRDIQHATVDSSLQLRSGDLMLLYTDGVTELRNRAGVPFGLDRLCDVLARLHAEPVANIQGGLSATLDAWGVADDDVTVLIARYVGSS
jgi:serine phosphatase RsbU (regulator of sigma subunit)